MENETELSPEESLKVIQSMINKTKDAVADDSFYFLLWGWLVFGCCVGQYVLKIFLHYPNHSVVWFLMPVGGVVSWIYGAQQSKTQKVKSFVNESLEYLWLALAISFIVLVIINVGSGAWQTAFTYYILLYAIGTFVSGSLIRFKPLVYGGLINFALAAASVRFSFDNQLLIGALAILISYIIPGHLLRMRYQKQKK
jgi:hypothetical protein